MSRSRALAPLRRGGDWQHRGLLVVWAVLLTLLADTLACDGSQGSRLDWQCHSVFVGPAEGGAVAGVANMGLEPPLTTRLALSHLKNRILHLELQIS